MTRIKMLDDYVITVKEPIDKIVEEIQKNSSIFLELTRLLNREEIPTVVNIDNILTMNTKKR